MNSTKLFEDSANLSKRVTIPSDFEVTVTRPNYDFEFEDNYSSEEEFYDHYEPYEEEFFDNGEYEAFNPEEEEKEHQAYISPRKATAIKPTIYWNSPTKKKDQDQSPSKKSSGWWDKSEPIPETKRVVNGVLNYAALLPPSEKKTPIEKKTSNRKAKKASKASKEHEHARSKNLAFAQRTNGTRANTRPNNTDQKPTSSPGMSKVHPERGGVLSPTRFCLSVVKNVKCFHAQCRFAHSYAELKECKFGERCHQVTVVQTNQDGTVELANKSKIATCTFKHVKESKHSYLKRVPQHTSPHSTRKGGPRSK